MEWQKHNRNEMRARGIKEGGVKPVSFLENPEELKSISFFHDFLTGRRLTTLVVGGIPDMLIIAIVRLYT